MKRILTNKDVLILIIVITWGSSFMIIKKTLPIFNPFQIGAFRAGISGLLLAFVDLPTM